MKHFERCSGNGDYFVGCTGQTVYLYDRNNRELKKFKDLIYAYTPLLSPNGRIFVVKSTDGWLAVYSLEALALVKKFRYSKVDGSQDDGFCFSGDGKSFFNVERQFDACHTAISVYDTEDFSRICQISSDDIMVEYIEYDRATQTCYLLGYKRDSHGFRDHRIVAKLDNNRIVQITQITQEEYKFYSSYMESQMMGLTETMKLNQLKLMGYSETSYEWKWMVGELEMIQSMKYSLGKLHRQYYP